MENRSMRAAVLDGPLQIEVRDIAIPTPGPNEVLVKVFCIGVCGSDIHYYESGRIGRYVVEQPIVLGHELAGDVVSLGSQVTWLQVGDRVAVEPGIPCNHCDFCKQGRYNLCPQVSFMATPPVNGAWSEYVSVRADFLHLIPASLSYEEGALLEPLSVGFHAMRRGHVGPGDRVLISGLGPVGILAGIAAQMFGASQLIGTDVVPYRLEVASKLGFNAVLNPQAEDVSAELAKLTDGTGITTVVETSGNIQALQSAIANVNFGGKILIIGLPTSNAVAMDIPMLVDKELDVYGVFRYVNTYPAAIQALSRGTYHIQDIVTQSYCLEDVKLACEMARTHKEESIKVMIYPGR